jgi:hypothetical protein
MRETLVMPADEGLEDQVSLADLFLQASRSLAHSDARLYRSVDRHLSRTREILRQAEAETGELPLENSASSPQLLFGAPSFERQTRKSLVTLCKQHGVRGYSRMSKAKMIQYLQQAGVVAPPLPVEALSKGEMLTLLRNLLSIPTQDG